MKAIILAAGKGTRLAPLTNNIPKVLIPINGKPFLSYVIENLQQARISEIGIVVGYKKEKIKDFLMRNKIKATIIEQSEQKGTGHAVMQAKNFVGKNDFIVLGGDNLFSINDLKKVQKKDNFCYIVGKEESNWQKYGVLVIKENKLLKIVEKPKQFAGNLINTGLYKFTPEIFTALEKIKPSERGEYELTDAITILARQGKVKVLKLKDYWLDLGCKEDISTIEGFLSLV